MKRQQGSALLEFAIVAILFLSILFGICGFGHALYVYHFVSHAAKSAARWAAVNGAACADDTESGAPSSCTTSSASPATSSDVADFVTNQAPSGIDPDLVNTTIPCGTSDKGGCADSIPSGCSTTGNAPGCTVKVTVSYNYNFLFPLVHTNPITLSSSAEMVIAH
jgi:Flp pilus assembly protein TadG